MKINMLLGAILLSSIGLVADDNSIEYESSYQIMGMTYSDYNIKGNGEECSVTYREDEDLVDTTCSSSTNSKGVKIFCTKHKKICKTKKEIDDFVNPPNQTDPLIKASKVLKHWVKAHNTKDMKLLSKLYAKKITYYGSKRSRERCIKDKKRALKKFPEFYQHIEGEDFIEVTPNIYKVTFTKWVRLEIDREWKDYPSYLLIDISTSSILVEGDEVTDKNKK